LIREPSSVRKLFFTASVMVNWLTSRMAFLPAFPPPLVRRRAGPQA
jgi:hypothetical protein